MRILVTGGAGFIGSHTVIELHNAGHEVVVYDNLCNASPESLTRVEAIIGEPVPFVEGDIRDYDKMRAVFDDYDIDCVIHFAGLKAVGESVYKPIEYYDNNVSGTVVLLKAMRDAGCTNIIFSSSATVYGTPESNPITEEFPKGEATNPYGNTKVVIEEILTDVQYAHPEFNVVLLRYFNPIGAHISGTIGEDPRGVPNNLMPYITQVAVGKLEKLHVFGGDYDTPDGSCIRDYIHVVDLGTGHVAALKAIESNCGLAIYNLGTGRGTSVIELVKAFEKATGVEVPYVVEGRREGDVMSCWSDASKAERELGWVAAHDIEDMCRDSWRWQQNNPEGYGN